MLSLKGCKSRSRYCTVSHFTAGCHSCIECIRWRLQTFVDLRKDEGPSWSRILSTLHLNAGSGECQCKGRAVGNGECGNAALNALVRVVQLPTIQHQNLEGGTGCYSCPIQRWNGHTDWTGFIMQSILTWLLFGRGQGSPDKLNSGFASTTINCRNCLHHNHSSYLKYLRKD